MQQSASPLRPFRVLSLDGGGMRGLYTAALLGHLARLFDDARATKKREFDVGRAFDLIVGTSTGGILACSLAAGYPPERIVELFREHGPRIFKTPIPRSPGNLFKFALLHLLKPANDGHALRETLGALFGNMTIASLYADRGVALCLQTLNMDTHAPIVLKTPHLAGKHRDDAVTIVDACMATSAAPLVFPLAKFELDGTVRTVADGGLWANSPVMLGLVEALALCGERPIEIFSVGTCPPPAGRFSAKGEGGWGLLRWRFGIGMLEASLDAQSAAAKYAFEQLRPHLRIDARLARLAQTAPSAEHQKLIGLDRADDNALSALESLAAADAEAAHGLMTRDPGAYPFVFNIFSSLKPVLVNSK